MTKSKASFKEFIKKHRAKIGIVISLGCGAALGYYYGINNNIWKRFDEGEWNFEIFNNNELKVTRFDTLTDKTRWYRFSGKDTKVIVDKLMDQLYPGD